MKKAVKAHEDFKFAAKILRTNGMDAKKGRLLLKRHYVALLEQEGDKNASKRKVPELKRLFWSNEDVVHKYVTADHGEDDDDETSDEEVAGAMTNLSLRNSQGPSDDEVDEVDEWLPSDAEDDCLPEEVTFDVDDEVDAFYNGDETTTPRWEAAVVEEVDHDMDQFYKYRVIFKFNGEEVSIYLFISFYTCMHSTQHSHTHVSFFLTHAQSNRTGCPSTRSDHWFDARGHHEGLTIRFVLLSV